MGQPLTAPPLNSPPRSRGKVTASQIESEDPKWIANQGSQQGTEGNAVVGDR